MEPVYIDIETLPADPASWEPTEAVEAPSNYKDPEKIAAYVADARAKAHGRTGLDVHAGRLLCVAVAVGGDEPEVAYDATASDPVPMLALVDSAIVEATSRGNGRTVVVGHNIASFDAPWLWRLAVKHGHPLARSLPYRKWGEGLADTIQLWSATNPTDRVKLSTIARFLGLGDKSDGMDGAEVWPAYQRGEHERIKSYCAQDVRLVRDVYTRITGPRR